MLPGVSAVLVKPFTISALFDVIMQVFGHHMRPRNWRDKKTEIVESLEKLAGRQLLVVEDNEINQMVAKGLLEKLGFLVSIAENGEEAVEMVSGGRFDAVLMDIQMPGMDGYEATARIREDLKLGPEKLPIIAMTAHAMSGDRDKILHAGLNDYLTKPIDVEKLSKALLTWLQPDSAAEAGPASVDEIAPVLIAADSVLDANAALQRLGDNQTFYVRLLKKVRETQPNSARNIRDAIQLGDIPTAHRLVHSLKSVGGTIGATELNSAAANLEQVLGLEDVSNYESKLVEVERALENVMITLAGMALE